jgi:hypothetical protein
VKAIAKKPKTKAVASKDFMRAASNAGNNSRSKFVCVKCNESFSSGWALGGHASRVHPGESDSYKRKIERRDERAFERHLLFLAKQKHSALYGKDAPLNRVKIRKFKKELKRQLLADGRSPSQLMASKTLSLKNSHNNSGK